MSKISFWEAVEDAVGLALLVWVCLFVYHL